VDPTQIKINKRASEPITEEQRKAMIKAFSGMEKQSMLFAKWIEDPENKKQAEKFHWIAFYNGLLAQSDDRPEVTSKVIKMKDVNIYEVFIHGMSPVTKDNRDLKSPVGMDEMFPSMRLRWIEDMDR